MQKFSQFTKNFAFSESLNSVLCRSSLDEAMKKLCESLNGFAFIVPKRLKLVETHQFLLSKGVAAYPVSYTLDRLPQRMFLIVKPPATSNDNFRNTLSDLYAESDNFSILYSGDGKTKVLAESKVLLETTDLLDSCTKLNARMLGLHTTCHPREINVAIDIRGIEVPVDASAKLAFKKQGLLIYPSYSNTAVPSNSS
jgi:hypothetical protein